MIDPNNFLSYQVWLGLPKQTRYKIADKFGISPRGVGHTQDDRVIADNFVHSDLAVITKEKMQEVTGEKSDDFYFLFGKLVDYVNKVEGETSNTSHVEQKEQTETRPSPVSAPVGTGKGRKKKGTGN